MALELGVDVGELGAGVPAGACALDEGGHDFAEAGAGGAVCPEVVVLGDADVDGGMGCICRIRVRWVETGESLVNGFQSSAYGRGADVDC